MGNKLKTAASLITLILVIGAAFCVCGPNSRSLLSEETQYELILNSSNKPAISDDNASQRIRYVDIMYSDIEDSSSGHVVFNSGGVIANEVMVHGLIDIIVVFEPVGDADLVLYYGESCLPLTNQTTLVSETINTDVAGSTYFILQAKWFG